MTREEAIEVVRKNLPHLGIGATEMTDALGTLIPELRESEDERIRKELVFLCNEWLKDAPTVPIEKKHINMILAWLEKQKVQEVEIGSEIVAPVGQAICIEPELINPEPKPIQKEQKPALIAENDNWYICIKDFYAGGKKWASVGDLVQAKNGMYMMGRDDISEWFRRAYYEEVRDAFGPNTDTNIPEKPVECEDCAMYLSGNCILPNGKCENVKSKQEWSEEDDEMLEYVIGDLNDAKQLFHAKDAIDLCDKEIAWLKSLRPHWKPSEEQMIMLRAVLNDPNNAGAESCQLALSGLYEQLKKL